MGHTTTEDDLGANALFGTGHYLMATWCIVDCTSQKSSKYGAFLFGNYGYV
jgi:hypothetical protein